MAQEPLVDLSAVLEVLDDIRQVQSRLSSSVDLLEDRLNRADREDKQQGGHFGPRPISNLTEQDQLLTLDQSQMMNPKSLRRLPHRSRCRRRRPVAHEPPSLHESFLRASVTVQSRSLQLILRRTYPKQIGIKPLPMVWGHSDPNQRGPVVVSRASSTIRRRNGRRRAEHCFLPH